MKTGRLYGIGVGPGDPELVTLKAARLLRECDIVAVPNKGVGEKTALDIVKDLVVGKRLLLCPTPMTRDKKTLDENYASIADELCALLNEGKVISFITLGDPTIYSTYVYIHKIVSDRGYEAELVPGVPSFCAAAARLGISLCERDERLLVVPAGYESADCMDIDANKVFMKAGKGLARLRALLDERGQLESAQMVENCGMKNERVYHSLAEADGNEGYFSLVISKEA